MMFQVEALPLVIGRLHVNMSQIKSIDDHF